MKLRLLRERAINELKLGIKGNLQRYRCGEFEHLTIDPALSFESDIEIDNTYISQLKAPIGADNFESHNCAVLLGAFKKLSPYQAADERVWVMLSHTLLLEHGRQRWPIPKNDEDAVKHIVTHFFASSQRQLERDNVGSRLWWMGHLCSRVQGLSLKESLDVLLFKSDVRANIVERPTTSQSIPIFSAIISKLAESHNGTKKLFERRIFRSLMVAINGLGGYKLLDALPRREVERLIDEIVKNDLRLSSL